MISLKQHTTMETKSKKNHVHVVRVAVKSRRTKRMISHADNHFQYRRHGCRKGDDRRSQPETTPPIVTETGRLYFRPVSRKRKKVLEQESAIKIFCPSAVRRTPYAVRRTPYAVSSKTHRRSGPISKKKTLLRWKRLLRSGALELKNVTRHILMHECVC
ncbi:unnamed protein product, partial [Nesidiocoris tenuis]